MICYKFSSKGKCHNYLNFFSVSVYLFARKKIYKSGRTGGIFLARKLKLKPWGITTSASTLVKGLVKTKRHLGAISDSGH